MRKIVLFDGQCALCSSAVQFILQRNDCELLYFASLQSEIARDLCLKYGIDPDDLSSIVFIDQEGAWRKSEAALRIATYLKFPWKFSKIFRIIPRAWRDSIYDLIARNRYRWFGTNDKCFLPKKEWHHRFLS